jgi:hypothetical protein
MGWFSRSERWERTFRLRDRHGPGRAFLAVLFWFWGLVGLLFNVGSLMGLTGAIGVGTSAYLATTSLIWIGGMVLFGLGALLSHSDLMASDHWRHRPMTSTFRDKRDRLTRDVATPREPTRPNHVFSGANPSPRVCERQLPQARPPGLGVSCDAAHEKTEVRSL